MDEITETVVYEEGSEENSEALLEKFEDRKKLRLDDVAATQAVICVLAAAGLFVTNLLYPATAQAFFDKLRHCMTDSTYILPNPVDSLISYLQSR